MTVTPHILEKEAITDDLAMLLVGDKKAGKSVLASTAPEPVLFLDFDQRFAALRKFVTNRKVYALSFADSTNTTIMPTAANEMLDILGKLERDRSLKNVGIDAEGQVATIVFDSIQSIADSARRYVLYTNSDVTKSITMGGRTFRVPKSYHAWGGEQSIVEGAIMQARSIKGMNVICILHECMEQDERSTQENPIYTGKIEVFPRRYNTLLVYFNEVWRLTREHGRIPKVACDPDGKFIQAATALGIDKIETPNISSVLQLARSKK